MDKVVALCKRRGVIFPASEIYGGIANTYDYGHYGVLLKRNVVDAWWQAMIGERDDIVALDSAIIQHPRTWEASGHLAGFTDPLVDCRTRAAVDERVGEAGEVPRRLPRARMLDDRRVERDDVVALSDHRLPPGVHDVALEQDAVMTVVVGVGDPAVDLGGGEDHAAPLAERDDLVHGHDIVGHEGRILGG